MTNDQFYELTKYLERIARAVEVLAKAVEPDVNGTASDESNSPDQETTGIIYDEQTIAALKNLGLEDDAESGAAKEEGELKE